MSMNIDQILSVLRVLLSVGGPVGALLVARGMSPDQVTDLSTALLTIIGAAPPLVAAVWGAFAHTNAAKVAAVQAMPKNQILGVVVAPTASDGVLAAANDPAMTKVMMATPALTAAIAAAPVTVGTKP
jgi:hypothetical protein